MEETRLWARADSWEPSSAGLPLPRRLYREFLEDPPLISDDPILFVWGFTDFFMGFTAFFRGFTVFLMGFTVFLRGIHCLLLLTNSRAPRARAEVSVLSRTLYSGLLYNCSTDCLFVPGALFGGGIWLLTTE